MKILFYSMLLVFTVSCAKKTSTPEEFINVNKVKKDVYKKDLSLLTAAIKVYYDSINSVVNPRYVTKFLGVKIDTVFYGNDNKIVLLAILTTKNEYAEKGMLYEGKCYIAYKRNNIEFFDQLKYSSTATESLEKASEMIRRIYLGEMNNIDGRYNINDTRFWDSSVWEEARQMKEERKNFEEMKKTHPENVYDPNDR